VIELYRPSNGTEGECFMARWCAVCRHDRGSRDESLELDGCNILAMTMAVCSANDPDHPKEWRYGDDGHPVCTAFCWDDEEPNQPLDPVAVIRPLL
jgi:hypothetical protein